MFGVRRKVKDILETIKTFKHFQTLIKNSFVKVKKEMDNHLESINQNTNEIQNIYDYMHELEGKMEKLNERIDDLQLYLSPQIQEEQFKVTLSHREQEVFLILYAANDGVTPQIVAKRLGFTDEMVQRYIYNMIMKGIPILKQFEGDQIILYLDLKFKDLQARKNILKIDDKVSSQLLDDHAI